MENNVKNFFKNRKILFAAWACENEFYSTFKNWYQPLKSHFGDFPVFDPQKYLYYYGEEEMNRMFMEKIEKEKPDYLLIWIVNEIVHLNTLKKIRERFPKIKIIAFYGDDDTQFEDVSRYVSLFCDYNLVFQKEYIDKYEQEGIQNVFFTCGGDVKMFKPEKLKKIYDVVFIGTPKKDYRYDLIKFIKEKGVNLKLFGFGWNNYPEFSDIYGGPLGNKDLIKVYNQSKINLCFSRNDLGKPHMKGRIFKIAACKSFVLMENSPIYASLFNKNELVMFNDKNDLIKKINYYLKNEKERERIADAIYKKIKLKYNLNSELSAFFKLVYKDEMAEKKTKDKKLWQLPKINDRVIILDEKEVNLSVQDLKKKTKDVDYIAFKTQGADYLDNKNYFQIYSLEKSGKQMSCCDYFVYSEILGNYLMSISNETLTTNSKYFLIPILNINQLMVRKEFFFNNLENFRKLSNGVVVDFINGENTIFVSFPFVRIKDDEVKFPGYEIMRKSFKMKFMSEIRTLMFQKKLFQSWYLYKLLVKGVDKPFIIRHLIECFKNKNKFETFKKINTTITR